MKIKIILFVLAALAASCLYWLSSIDIKPISFQYKPRFVKMESVWKSITRSGIERYEKYMAHTYVCPAGVPTIGYGFTDKKLVEKDYVSQKEAKRILDAKIIAHCDIVKKHVKVKLTEPQMYALASFTYNCGVGNLSRLINGKGRLNSGNYSSVPRLMSQYCTANGKVLRGLELRRAWEIKLWNS